MNRLRKTRNRIVAALLVAIMTSLPMIASAVEPVYTQIFADNFQTLRIHPENDQLGVPVLRLDTDDRLVVSFDELSSDRRYMRYEVIHCDAQWRPDQLLTVEYLDGFNEGIIDDYAYSRATTVQYINYRIVIPNEDIRLKLSGNYLLRVYDESDPDETLLQARFAVVEPLVRVSADVTTRTDVDYNDRSQQLSVRVHTGDTGISNRFEDLKIVICQNGRVDNVAVLTMPMSVSGRDVIYEHQPQLIFPAGNEYRRFETVSTTYPGMHIKSLSYSYPYYHADLYEDQPRAARPYSYDQTQHGRYVVREYNADDSDTQADYVVTHFALDVPELPGYDVFIDGDMTLRRFAPESRMVFNRGTNRYEASLLLKQGSYNYQYLAVPSGRTVGETRVIEGDKYQTANEYTIYVYYRRPGERYDRLIGFYELN